MKLTKSKLKQIIKEELGEVNEGWSDEAAALRSSEFDAGDDPMDRAKIVAAAENLSKLLRGRPDIVMGIAKVFRDVPPEGNWENEAKAIEAAGARAQADFDMPGGWDSSA